MGSVTPLDSSTPANHYLQLGQSEEFELAVALRVDAIKRHYMERAGVIIKALEQQESETARLQWDQQAAELEIINLEQKEKEHTAEINKLKEECESLKQSEVAQLQGIKFLEWKVEEVQKKHVDTQKQLHRLRQKFGALFRANTALRQDIEEVKSKNVVLISAESDLKKLQTETDEKYKEAAKVNEEMEKKVVSLQFQVLDGHFELGVKDHLKELLNYDGLLEKHGATLGGALVAPIVPLLSMAFLGAGVADKCGRKSHLKECILQMRELYLAYKQTIADPSQVDREQMWVHLEKQFLLFQKFKNRLENRDLGPSHIPVVGLMGVPSYLKNQEALKMSLKDKVQLFLKQPS